MFSQTNPDYGEEQYESKACKSGQRVPVRRDWH